MKKKPAKRRAPSLDSLARRINALRTTILNQMALIRLDIVTEREKDREILRTVTDHAARLLKEKETLQRQLAAREAPNEEMTAYYENRLRIREVSDANKFMSVPTLDGGIAPRVCAVAHLHRNGVPCSICGVTYFTDPFTDTPGLCRYAKAHSPGILCRHCGVGF